MAKKTWPKPLFDPRVEGENVWTQSKLEVIWEVIEHIAKEKYDIDYHPCDLVKVSAGEMLDLYTTAGMPEYPTHWSQGMQRAKLERDFQEGISGLALEIVVNTDPVQLYVMDNNTTTIQTMVLAHAGPGHGSFFKNNYLFKNNTQAGYIRTYLKWAKEFIQECELKYGKTDVERVQDVCEALKHNSVFRYDRSNHLEANRAAAAEEMRVHKETSFVDRCMNEDTAAAYAGADDQWENKFNTITEGEENLLYFFEKNSLVEPWKKEICRIYRIIAQYFYPQMLTKVMNEGWASFWHYTIMYDLYEEGYITEGSMQEFIDLHCSVVGHIDSLKAPAEHGGVNYNKVYGNSINPYTLGFYSFKELRKICEHPTDTDKIRYPHIAGKPWLETLKYIAYNFKDEEFVQQWVPDCVLEDLKLYTMFTNENMETFDIVGSHTDTDLGKLRSNLAQNYTYDNMFPRLDVTYYSPQEGSIELTYSSLYGRNVEGRRLNKLWGLIPHIWHGEFDMTYSSEPVQFDPYLKALDLFL